MEMHENQKLEKSVIPAKDGSWQEGDGEDDTLPSLDEWSPEAAKKSHISAPTTIEAQSKTYDDSFDELDMLPQPSARAKSQVGNLFSTPRPSQVDAARKVFTLALIPPPRA